MLAGVSGVLVAPGFGERGTEGKIAAIRYAREAGIPFLGICLGMQMAVVEFARTVCGMEGANSTEFDPDTPWPVVAMMADQKEVVEKGGTMRLGAYTCEITPGSLAHAVYGADTVQERHRHRYEVNNDLRYKLREGGLNLTGVNPKTDLVEIIELPQPTTDGDSGSEAGLTHPWFVGVQFHPEYRSNVRDPHPLFVGFIGAAIKHAHANDLIAEAKAPSRTRRVRRASARVLEQNGDTA